MPITFSNLKKLEKNVLQGTEKYNFNARLELDELETFEKAYGIVLPESYKEFLERFNGGMITRWKSTSYVDMTEFEPEHPSRDSFMLFSLEEVIDRYTSLRLDDWLLEEEDVRTYPIIPFCKTPEQELLFMVSNKGFTDESPIFASYEESGEYKCVKIAADFNSFLGYYIESDGFPALLPDDVKPSFQVFLEENNIISIAKEKPSHDEVIKRATALLKLDPDDAWSYCTRGNAHMYNGKTKWALTDLNKAIEMDDKEAFFYHCRGDLLLQYGSARKALIDMDISVKLEPDNKMFLTGRADALVKLGKYKKALVDCNRVLEMDRMFELALYTRKDVYEALGEDTKAKVDSDLIDELNS